MLIHTNFASINLFWCCEKVFVRMDMMGNGMDVGKDLMKNHYLKRGKFCSNLNIEDIHKDIFAVCSVFII